jgi:hypothetical protein
MLCSLSNRKPDFCLAAGVIAERGITNIPPLLPRVRLFISARRRDIMNKTVIGAFENDTEALQAKAELLAAGFPEQALSVHHATPPQDDQPDHNPGFMQAIRSLFTWDLDNYRDESYADHYAEAVRRGHAVLAATVDDSEVEMVCDLMDDAGALDIDERVTQWRSLGYTGGQAAANDVNKDEEAADVGSGRHHVRIVPHGNRPGRNMSSR